MSCDLRLDLDAEAILWDQTCRLPPWMYSKLRLDSAKKRQVWIGVGIECLTGMTVKSARVVEPGDGIGNTRKAL
jgi:hypothetical protein